MSPGVATSIEVQCAHDAGHAQHVRVRTAKPATAVANQRKVFRRENAGRSCQIALRHQCIHSDIGVPTSLLFLTNDTSLTPSTIRLYGLRFVIDHDLL